MVVALWFLFDHGTSWAARDAEHIYILPVRHVKDPVLDTKQEKFWVSGPCVLAAHSLYQTKFSVERFLPGPRIGH